MVHSGFADSLTTRRCLDQKLMSTTYLANFISSDKIVKPQQIRTVYNINPQPQESLRG